MGSREMIQEMGRDFREVIDHHRFILEKYILEIRGFDLDLQRSPEVQKKLHFESQYMTSYLTFIDPFSISYRFG